MQKALFIKNPSCVIRISVAGTLVDFAGYWMSSHYKTLYNEIQQGRVAVLDSGVSTELERQGAPMKDSQWSGRVSIDAFDILVNTHKAYIDAGADIITVNSYASSRLVLGDSENESLIEKINKRNIEAALEARSKTGANEVLIAGSISHQVAWQHLDGQVKKQIDIPVSKDELEFAYTEMRELFEAGGVDLLLLEMMSIPARAIPLYECVSNSTLPVWCGLSATRQNHKSEIASFHDETVLFEDNVKTAALYNFDVMGVMHTAVDLISGCNSIIKNYHNGPLMAYPDSGYFQAPNWQFIDIITPQNLLNFAEIWQKEGVKIFGGCCGLGPEHTGFLSQLK